jgi:micrococcal nuclease
MTALAPSVTALVAAVLSSPGSVAVAAPVLHGTVFEVVDGDSLRVQLSSGPVEVRLHAADTPEHDQPGGREAKRALRKRLARGTQIGLAAIEQDRYERMVAVVHASDVVINEWLVREGHAWAYRRYADDPVYCRLEDEARRARRGLWKRPPSQWVAPWDWRHRQRDPSFRTPDRAHETLATCLAAMPQRRDARVGGPSPRNPVESAAALALQAR